MGEVLAPVWGKKDGLGEMKNVNETFNDQVNPREYIER
jgi:hypothetical protein